MIKRVSLFCLVAVAVLSSFVLLSTKSQRATNENFLLGETLKYRMHYGFIDAGEAVIAVDPKLYKASNKICYKLTVDGRSTGSFDLFAHIKDTWGAYVDTATMVPWISYRVLAEGKYRKKEVVYLDQDNHNAKVVVEGEPEKNYEIPTDVMDIVSGYYYLRTLEFEKMKVGEVFTVAAFMEDKSYNFSMTYLGKGKVKTKGGTFNSIIISPIMPENQLFRSGDHAIKLWISDDGNKIPLKAKAEMFVGSVEVDLIAYSGLRHKPNIIK